MNLHVRVLGGLEVSLDGQAVNFPTEKAKLLFAYLIVHAGQAFSREQLADLLWLDFEVDKAKANLRATLSRIKKPLVAAGANAPCVLADRTHVRFNPEIALDLDVARLHQGQHQFEQTKDANALEQVLTLYRGDFMAGFYEDWCLVEQEHWRERYTQLLGRLTEYLINAGQDAKAIGHCLRGLQLDELQEDLHQKLIVLHLRQGNQAAALKQYERCCQVLTAELGSEPLPETQALYDRIKQRSRQAQALQSLLQKHRPSTPFQAETLPLVGRETELRQLQERFEQARRGQGQLLALCGEAGSGKTRLVQTFLATLDNTDTRILRGRCSPLEHDLPLAPWLQALRSVEVDWDETLNALGSPWAGEINALLPELAPPSSPVNPELNAEASLNRRLEAGSKLLQHWAQQRPLVVFLDDVHWADELTLRLLHYLGHIVTTTPLWLVVSLRREEVTPDALLDKVLSQWTQMRVAHSVDLEPLSDVATEELLRAALDERGTLSATLQRELSRWARGNPLLLLEVLRRWIEQGTLQHREQGWFLDSERLQRSSAPQSVQALFQLSLKRLPLSTQHVLQWVALAGEVSQPDLLAQAAEQPLEQVLDALNSLVQRNVLLNTQDDFVFRHEVYRQALYQSLSSTKRLYLHDRWAHTLEMNADKGQYVAALAHHFEQANVPQKAFSYGLQAAQNARDNLGYQDALQHLERAHNALKRLRGASQTRLRQRCELLVFQVGVLDVLGKREQQQRCVNELVQLARSLRDTALHAQIQLIVARLRRQQGKFVEAQRALAQGFVLIQRKQSAVEQALLREQGLLLQSRGQFELARRCAQRCWQTRPQQDVASTRLALLDLGITHWHLGLYGSAFDDYEQALDLCRGEGDRLNEGLVWVNLGNAHWSVGLFELAEADYDRGKTLLQRVGYLRGEALVWVCQGVLLRDDKRFGEALQCYEQAEILLKKVEDPHSLTDLWGKVAEVQLKLGKLNRARQQFERALASSRRLGATALETYTLAHQANLFQALGQDDEARTTIERAIGLLQRSNDTLFAVEAYFYQYQILKHQDKPALEALSEAYNLLQRQAKTIKETRFRKSFLTQVPLNNAIVTAWHHERRRENV